LISAKAANRARVYLMVFSLLNPFLPVAPGWRLAKKLFKADQHQQQTVFHLVPEHHAMFPQFGKSDVNEPTKWVALLQVKLQLFGSAEHVPNPYKSKATEVVLASDLQEDTVPL
jgi:hypothetical protein